MTKISGFIEKTSFVTDDQIPIVDIVTGKNRRVKRQNLGFMASDGTITGATAQIQPFTNGVTVGSGTVGAPPIAFISSPTTGFYRAAADAIGVVIAGAEDFRITADTFTALSGSKIATDTIDPTTAAAGVTIDGVLLKDQVVTAKNGEVIGDLTNPGGFIYDGDSFKFKLISGNIISVGEDSGWGAMTGTPVKTAIDADAAYPAGAAYNEAEIDAIAAGLVEARKRLKAYDDYFFTRGWLTV